MPVAVMLHENEPKRDLTEKIGSVEGVELFHNQVLVAVYFRPERTKSGIYLTDNTKDEDRHQSKLGLIVKVGPNAFAEDDKWSWPKGLGVGDWVFYRPSDGWSVTVNNDRDRLCRILDDVDIRGRVPHPDQIW